MNILLTDAGKRFNRDWIFRHFSYHFKTGISYAITGPNGSGKSTLLQAIAGSMYLSEGNIQYQKISNTQHPISSIQYPGPSIQPPALIPQENIYQHISIAAPYLELVEEMTAKEFLHFHEQFKSFIPGIEMMEILSLIGLENAANKQIRYFSSGMKQRIKLAQAVFSAVPVLLLDEPCTNLDAAGYALYHSLINTYCSHKLVIISSNDSQEMDLCTEKLNILDYK